MTIIERVRELDNRTQTLNAEEPPRGTSLVTKNYPDYIVPAGETLSMPAGIVLYTGGEVVGSTSGAISETTTGDSINVVKDGACENFSNRINRVTISGLNITSGSDIITGFTASNITQITSGIDVSRFLGGFPYGTVISSVDIPGLQARASNNATVTSSGTILYFEKQENVGVSWDNLQWFGDGERPRYSTLRVTSSFGGSVSSAIVAYLLTSIPTPTEADGRIAFCQLIRSEDCQHMLGSKVSARALLEPSQWPSPSAGIAILEWRGTVDQRPQTIATNWTTNPPTLVSNLFLMGETFRALGSNSLYKVENVQLTDTFSNLMILVYSGGGSGDIQNLTVSQVQLERGTTSTDYRRYGE